MSVLKRKDIYFAVAVLAIALLLFAWQQYGTKAEGGLVLVEREGEIIGSYPLNGRERLVFTDGEGKKNVLVIREGKAYMEEADCPDQLCVRQKAIERNGESIICLPHRLAVRITGGKEAEVDVMLR